MKETKSKKEKEGLEEQGKTEPQTDVQDKEEKPEDLLPKFPPKNAKESSEFPGGEAEPEVLTEIEIGEVCEDIIALPFELWGVVKKGVAPLSEKERKNLGKPFARLVLKYKVQAYVKDEFYFLFILGIAISKRLEFKKKDADNHSGETGKREDEPR